VKTVVYREDGDAEPPGAGYQQRQSPLDCESGKSKTAINRGLMIAGLGCAAGHGRASGVGVL
jgi:hypothetical protein